MLLPIVNVQSHSIEKQQILLCHIKLSKPPGVQSCSREQAVNKREQAVNKREPPIKGGNFFREWNMG